MAYDPEESRSLEYTPTWIVAVVCSVIVLVSFCAERGLHRLGKFLEHKKQDALRAALEKLKEELMLLGFISLLMTVSQSLVSKICIPSHLASYMLPCKMEVRHEINNYQHFSHQTILKNRRRLLSEHSTASLNCKAKGTVPLLTLEGLHQLHIFIFVLAVVHVIFCVSTVVLGGAKIRHWKRWEDSIRRGSESGNESVATVHHRKFFFQRATEGHYRKLPIVRWVRSFFKQFYGSVTNSDYIALRSGFIQKHFPSATSFNFHKYILRTLQHDFKRIVGISWYLWLFVVVFLLLNIDGWHSYFWLSFLPLILLLLVGAKLEHIISSLAREVVEKAAEEHVAVAAVKPSDEHFWFDNPSLVLYLIHFILFQNSFEIAFFVWIWSTYGYTSCIMEKLYYIIPRLIVGVIVQVLCSYSTLPLYALVTQMGSTYKPGIFGEEIHGIVSGWAGGSKGKEGSQINRMEREPFGSVHVDEDTNVGRGTIIELSCPNQQDHIPSP